MQKTYYDITNLKNENATYNILFGKRSNGKSYQIKKMVLEEYFNNGNKFIYLRRTPNEIKRELVVNYFDDFDIKKWTNNKYNCITVRSNEFYLANIGDDFKIKLGESIGYIWTLLHEENYKSGSYLDVTNIIFEEFMTNRLYLAKEPTKLESLYSTVDRNRNIVKIWLIGNSISRINPYLDGWNIKDIFTKIKIGEIKSKFVKTQSKDKNLSMRKIAVEYCKNQGGESGTISSNMIDSGDFEVDIQPLLPYSRKLYTLIFRFVFQYKNYKFICEYLNLNRDNIFFIYPKYDKIKENTIVISDEVKQSRYYGRNIYTYECNNKKILDIFSQFKESNIFYCNNMCGTEFKQLIDFTIKL